MIFEIFQNGAWIPLDVDAYPQLTDTMDESFDTCQIVLKPNIDEEAMEPDQTIRAREGNLSRHFVIMSDQVTVASSYPLAYKHTVTLAQNIAKWKKFLIRNQVFSQPPSECIIGKCSMAFDKTNAGLQNRYEPYMISIPFDTHMKVTKIQFRWGFTATYWNGSEYVNANIQAPTPKGRIILESADGARVELAKLPELTQGTSAGNWNDMDMDRFGWRIRGMAHLGPAKIIYESGYEAGNQDFDSSAPTDSSHPTAIVTFTFEVKCWVHYHSMYDVLSQLRDSAAQYIFDEARKPIPFELPTKGDFYDRLKKDIAPNFTWTQSTLYEALADFFSYYDAVMTLDEENVIGIEYMTPNGEEITNDRIGYSASSSSDERANGMVNFYSRAKRTMSLPDTKGTLMGLRAETFGVSAKGDVSMVFPDPIDHITKVEILVRDYRLRKDSLTQYQVMQWDVAYGDVIDITDRFVEQSVWNSLPKDQISDTDRRWDALYQQNTIPYSRGSKSISLSKTFTMNNLEAYFLTFVLKSAIADHMGIGKVRFPYRYDLQTGFPVFDENYPLSIYSTNPDDGEWDKVMVRVEYVAQTDGKVRLESEEDKVNREIISSQGGADCDMDKLSENMKGLLQRTGNETRSVTFAITDWNEAPRKGQSIGEWVASKVDYRITSDGKYIAVAELSKNFNRLSMRTKIDRAKRMTNVSNELVQDCEDIITEYVYFSTRDDIPSTDIAFDSDTLSELLGNTFPASVHTDRSVDVAIFEPYDSNGNNIIADLGIPMRKYAFGNCICFEMRYDSPMSAGNMMTHDQSGWFGYTKYYSTPILYADKYGFFDKADIRFLTARGDWSYYYPMVDRTNLEQVGAIFEYKYMKKPNERFGLNYEICFLTDPEAPKGALVIGRKFFEENGLINNGVRGRMRLYVNSDIPFSGDWEPDGNYVYVEVVMPTGKNNGYTIRCNIDMDMVGNWAITDDDGNIYLASNSPQEVKDKSEITFYLTPSKWRL